MNAIFLKNVRLEKSVKEMMIVEKMVDVDLKGNTRKGNSGFRNDSMQYLSFYYFHFVTEDVNAIKSLKIGPVRQEYSA